MFDTKPYEDKFESAVMHFSEELKKVRTGRAHPGQLEGIKVEVYGTLVPINQAANITAPEAQMLQVTPFDPGNITAISAAIRNDQSLGFNPSDDGRVIRVPVPALTEERRKLLVKQASEKVEETRIALRNIRQDALKDAKRKKENKELSEDDVKRVEKLIDGIMTNLNAKIDETFRIKEKDVLTI
ncbi:ribosome recycling factor [Candidatus Saccharibacteria bacterium CG11_big_fil_rev_8_21_14_0_20_41_19]|nr:ribosome recycling factor [Candidatus Saccharibacteria bacterium]PIQ70864.1 MAG: ribosome recycling factor [Candidatus Saccharibacteria bacterium CG11_big_fil_rev_8_21_14_0_20_41_19]PIZ61221.1 MAG: ribosome recycling factor [Candidatus Saccharibacteria bacterium CG_4_10_14_0_2_um_filter_41_11]PJC29653.1 MAG: ribosome recycling factor [Candidatus Saccharibacteria bacterium CG_4_9_14_0_2_um_filter_41_9]PJE65788.1 MAG: ribosome recycling factor [Candidatus Saccharibacteria bacterium CG10_big_fi